MGAGGARGAKGMSIVTGHVAVRAWERERERERERGGGVGTSGSRLPKGIPNVTGHAAVPAWAGGAGAVAGAGRCTRELLPVGGEQRVLHVECRRRLPLRRAVARAAAALGLQNGLRMGRRVVLAQVGMLTRRERRGRGRG